MVGVGALGGFDLREGAIQDIVARQISESGRADCRDDDFDAVHFPSSFSTKRINFSILVMYHHSFNGMGLKLSAIDRPAISRSQIVAGLISSLRAHSAID